MAKDPVCGMDVAETSIAQQMTHEGTTYYFCAPGCRKAFEREPAKYLAPDHQAHM
jgi:Cu+-exporting ATPase